MVYMQRSYLKIVVPSILLVIALSTTALAQTTSFRLKTADSLFQAKRYTQSFEHYQAMLKQNQYTPAMLLKMAFIQEGLLHIGQSMYYLNLYFITTHDKTALDKMNELATKYNLEGYEASETDKLLTTYYDNYNYVSLAIVAFMVLAFALTFYTRYRLQRKPIASFSLLCFFAATLFVHIVYGERAQIGIVTNPSTYVMNGPSAAASLKEIIGDGHKVEIIGKKDVWLKIRWGGETAFVRDNTLQPVKL